MLRQKSISLARMPAVTTPRPKPKRTEKKAAGSPVAADADFDREVFEALRQWRRETSTQLGVPAYLVFPDKTLEDLARVLP